MLTGTATSRAQGQNRRWPGQCVQRRYRRHRDGDWADLMSMWDRAARGFHVSCLACNVLPKLMAAIWDMSYM